MTGNNINEADKLREMRAEAFLGLRMASEKTGISAMRISQIECGKGDPLSKPEKDRLEKVYLDAIEAKKEEKVEKSLKKMKKVVQFFSRLVEGEDDPIVRLALLDSTSKIVADIYRIAIERASISEGRKDRLKKDFLNHLHTIMEGDGIVALLEEEEMKK